MSRNGFILLVCSFCLLIQGAALCAENVFLPWHEQVSVTVFWIGEESTGANGHIPNIQSAWDDLWSTHYGGVDTPDQRRGFLPQTFRPRENPFYCALPYNDFDAAGERKGAANEVIPWARTRAWGALESMCKNQWLQIVGNGRTVYAQWEDVGPFGEDDAAYVFGHARPHNTINNHAGLDVSPAVRDYLGLFDVDVVNWRFVSAEQVPDGPWREQVTRSQICWRE